MSEKENEHFTLVENVKIFDNRLQYCLFTSHCAIILVLMRHLIEICGSPNVFLFC